MSSHKAIIIGSGMAGLASAIRLAVQGFEVTVFEKNKEAGGKLGWLELDDYHFDTGPSLFTQPQNIEELFTLAGEPVGEYFQYQTVPVSCKYFYDDGTVVKAFTDAGKFAKELEEKLDEDGNKLIEYLAASKKMYQHIGSFFLDHSLHKRSTLFKVPLWKALTTVRGKHLFGSMHQLNRSHFRNKKTVQLFDRYATYNGSDPYRAPGMLTLIPHVENNEGVFYPEGGMISISRALYRLALKKGVKFCFNSPVQRIIRLENKVKGVVVNGENHLAGTVVSNMDIYFTYRQLLMDESRSKKILKQERSSSALVFYWGIKKEFSELELHNIFFSEDYQKEFDHLFRKKKMYEDPTIYLNITSKCEPGIHSPAGTENWFVMVNAPANNGQDWDQLKKECRATIISKLSRLLQTEIEPLIEVEESMDPITIENNTSSYMGSLYGSSSNSKMAAFMRHPNFSSPIKGLYFAGGSVHPGGGIPLCLKSAAIISKLVAADKKNNASH